VAQLSRGRVSVPAQAALSGSPKKASGFAGGSYCAGIYRQGSTLAQKRRGTSWPACKCNS